MQRRRSSTAGLAAAAFGGIPPAERRSSASGVERRGSAAGLEADTASERPDKYGRSILWQTQEEDDIQDDTDAVLRTLVKEIRALRRDVDDIRKDAEHTRSPQVSLARMGSTRTNASPTRGDLKVPDPMMGGYFRTGTQYGSMRSINRSGILPRMKSGLDPEAVIKRGIDRSKRKALMAAVAIGKSPKSDTSGTPRPKEETSFGERRSSQLSSHISQLPLPKVSTAASLVIPDSPRVRILRTGTDDPDQSGDKASNSGLKPSPRTMSTTIKVRRSLDAAAHLARQREVNRWLHEPASIGPHSKRSAALYTAKATRRVNATPADVLESVVDFLLAPPGQSYQPGSAVLPDCKLRIAWDFVYWFVCFAEASFVILYVMSHDPAQRETEFLLVKLAASLLFLFDAVVVRRNTAMLVGWMIDEDRVSIHSRYARSWMAFDVFISIPWDLCLYWLNDHGWHEGVQCLRLLRVIRIPKLFPSSTPVRELPRFVELSRHCFWLGLLVHTTACIWLAIATREEVGYLPDDRLVTKYNLALYWALITLTSTGYGDILPASNKTRVYAQFTAVGGAILLLIIGGRVGAMFITTDPFILSQDERKRRLQAVMDRNEIPWDIQKEAFTIFPSILETNMHDYQDTLDELPYFIQEKLSNHIKERMIRRVPLFRSATSDFISRLVVALDEVVLPPGELVTSIGTTAAEMWFLQHGIAEVLDFQGSVTATLRTGSWFGEMSIVRETERTATVRTLTPCALYRLDKDSFDMLVGEFPVFYQRIQEEAEKALQARRKRQIEKMDAPEKMRRQSVARWNCCESYECDQTVSVLAMAWVAVARKRFKALLHRKRLREETASADENTPNLNLVPPNPPLPPPYSVSPSMSDQPARPVSPVLRDTTSPTSGHLLSIPPCAHLSASPRSERSRAVAARDIQRVWRGYQTRRGTCSVRSPTRPPASSPTTLTHVTSGPAPDLRML
eukprot:Hpha_TRINITY_DN15515_c1_g7::TRINITY_DN15515_c1_g7_i1::g.106048::m.106048